MMSRGCVNIGVDDIGFGLSDFWRWLGTNNHIFMDQAFGQNIFLIIMEFGGLLILGFQFPQILLDVSNRRFHSLNLTFHISY